MNKNRSDAIKLAYKEGRKEKFNPNPSKPCPNINKLKDLYINKKFGSHKISKEFGVAQTLILKWLRDANVQIRTLTEASKITLNGFKNGPSHPNWVGDKVSYSSLHAWVRQHKGTPQKCEHCGTTKLRKYEWASIDHKYLRDLDNWVRLCTKCHRQMDKKCIIK